VYLQPLAVMPMALGMTSAVIFRSMTLMSVKAITSCRQRDHNSTYISHPAKDVGMETQMVFRHVKPALNQNVLRQGTAVIYQLYHSSTHLQLGSRLHLRRGTLRGTLLGADYWPPQIRSPEGALPHCPSRPPRHRCHSHHRRRQRRHRREPTTDCGWTLLFWS